ncbi:MAG: DNA polymerase [Bacilli bacterium]|nr:DNA polymerase [Bacilli bacterium]
MGIDSLWGEEFTVPKEKEKAKTIAAKIAKPYNAKTSIEKQVKSKVIPLKEKLDLIEKEVRNKLSKQMNNVLCITSKEDFHAYIDKCIKKGRVAVDTETNNSLDPITCKLMGLCLYTPGEKQAYIPVNHRDPDSKERLDNQLTEKDIAEGLVRLLESKALFETQKGQFDYQVIYHTTGVKIRIDWDTLIAEKLIDENKYVYSLKELYVKQVDPEQEKYSIDSLFEGIEYADVDPEIFALYAATDAMMTSKLADIQREKLYSKELGNVIHLAREIEIPLLPVIGEMESAGMEVDQEYGKLLSAKYNTQLEEVDSEISVELEKLKPMIDAWRLTPDANFRPIIGRTKTINKIQYKYYKGSNRDGDEPYWYEAKTSRKLSDAEAYNLNLVATEQKSKSEQLIDPINLGSPTQLAILFYDILGAPTVSKKSPRGTGEMELIAISKKIDNPICKLVIKRRELVKLISTYIDVIPELAKRWPDGRVRTHFNPYGAATGRLSSSDPINFQNIPAHNKEVRMLFCSSNKQEDIPITSNQIIVKKFTEVNTSEGFVFAEDLKTGEYLILDNDDGTTEAIKIIDIKTEGLFTTIII